MNEADLKTSVRMYVRSIYDKDNSAMDKFNETLSLKEFETLIKYVNTTWYSHLVKDKDHNFDISKKKKMIYQIMRRCLLKR